MSEEKFYENIPIKNDDVKTYVRLDLESDKMSKIKIRFLFLYSIVSLAFSERIFAKVLSYLPDIIVYQANRLMLMNFTYIKYLSSLFISWIKDNQEVFSFIVSAIYYILLDNKIIQFFVALLFHFIIAWIIHGIAYERVTKKGIFEEIVLEIIKKIKNFRGSKKYKKPYFKKHFLIYLLSRDYFYANKYKRKLLETDQKCRCADDQTCRKIKDICYLNWDQIRIKNKYFIQFSNWLNIIFVSFLAVFTIVVSSISEYWSNILFWFILFRIISRFIEIAIAFYKDVVEVNDKIVRSNDEMHKSQDSKVDIYEKVNKEIDVGNNDIYIHRWKNSILLKSARISLAVHSLFEVIILFSLFYYVSFELNIIEIGFSNVDNVLPSQYWDFLLYSISVTTMNFSFDPVNVSSILGTAHVVQVILSMILIVLSISSYLGLEGTLSARNENFYLRTHTYKRKLKKLKEKLEDNENY
jgi:hypothetical protein